VIAEEQSKKTLAEAHSPDKWSLKVFHVHNDDMKFTLSQSDAFLIYYVIYSIASQQQVVLIHFPLIIINNLTD